MPLKAVEMNWFPFTYILDNLITNSIHGWLTKDYRSSGMLPVIFVRHRMFMNIIQTGGSTIK